jgi:hypothetical protein
MKNILTASVVVRVPGYRSIGPKFDSRHCQIFCKVVGLERGPPSLMRTVEELLGRKSSGSGLENREYCCRDLLCCPCNVLYLQKLALTLSASGCHLVGTVRSQTKATDFVFVFFYFICLSSKVVIITSLNMKF